MFFILCGHLDCVYIYTWICTKKNHQHSYGFQNLISSWGWGDTILEITLGTWVFKYLVPKVNGNQWQNGICERSQKSDLLCEIES